MSLSANGRRWTPSPWANRDGQSWPSVPCRRPENGAC
jgi:hypothetical protein